MHGIVLEVTKEKQFLIESFNSPITIHLSDHVEFVHKTRTLSVDIRSIELDLQVLLFSTFDLEGHLNNT